jgi:hypothetical protein
MSNGPGRILSRACAVLAACVVVAAPPTAAAPSIASQWKAHAFDAAAALEASDTRAKKLSKATDSPAWKHFVLETMLRAAWVLHLTQEEVVHKKEPGGEAFHLVLNGGKDAGLLDVVYLYDAKGRPIGTRVDSLPKGWRLVFFSPESGGSHRFGVITEVGYLVFDRDDPFAAMVLPET